MKIKKVGQISFSGDVYNFHCLPNENYFGQNVLVHNCYKTNSSVGRNMSLETFKKIFHKIPRTLTQIAFGVGSLSNPDGSLTNPDLWKIMEYCRTNDYNQVVPNITINGGGLTAENADKLVALCGAVAVSKYNPKDVCYDAVKMLTDRGLNQRNIHMILSQDTYDACFEVIRDSKEDKRLEKLNAIVFLMLKPRGDRNKLRPLQDLGKYKKLVEFAFENNVRLGFDSCSAHMLLKAVKDNPNFTQFKMAADPCESTCFSIYVNVDGKVFPCSFCDGEKDWENGIDLKVYNNMLDVWNSEKIVNWRKKLLKNGRKCPMFNLDGV